MRDSQHSIWVGQNVGARGVDKGWRGAGTTERVTCSSSASSTSTPTSGILLELINLHLKASTSTASCRPLARVERAAHLLFLFGLEQRRLVCCLSYLDFF